MVRCDTPKPEGSLTTRQPAEDSWISGNPTPHHRVPFSGTHDLTKIGQSLLCTESSTQNTICIKKTGNMAQYNTMTSLGPIMSESGLTRSTHPHYRIYRTNYHSPQEFNYNTLQTLQIRTRLFQSIFTILFT